MGNELDKEKHSRRFYDDDLHVEKRKNLIKAKSAYFDEHIIDKQPHRLYKCSGMNCGKSTCHMCGNPRKFFKEPTIKERSFAQTQLWSDTDETL
jgi:alpha-D-ribose 1-methylphosphonate 5-phosphate C-P lyase